MNRREAESFFTRLKDIRALVVGDLMLDEYLWGKTERISPEAPVQVVDVVREDLRLGGAGNVVNNLVALGCGAAVSSVIGGDDTGTLLRRVFTGKRVDDAGVFEDPCRATSKKTRVMAANQQIVRIDWETREDISRDFEERIVSFVRTHLSEFQVLIISDYLKGVLTPRLVAQLIAMAREAGVPVAVDPKGKDYGKYRGATILTPNRKEAEIASGMAIRDEQSLLAAGRLLLERYDLASLLITRSEEGMSLFLKNGEIVHIPTVAREVFDVTGAGDTVLACLAAGLACGLSVRDAAVTANVAAGIAVGKLGTSTVSPAEVIAGFAHEHPDSDAKIKNRDALAAIIAAEKERGKTVVFTNGCFDLLHVGHVRYLQKARTFGDILVLGLNSDASVRRLKGDTRPLISEEERAHILAALDCIDYVVIFDEDTPLNLIQILKPFILVKGGDYTPEGVVGKDVVESYGGRVELVTFVDGRSTSNLVEKILKAYAEPVSGAGT